MRLTVAARYAMRTALHLSASAPRPVRIGELVERQNIPESSLRPLLRWLRAKRVIRLQRGRNGGYLLAGNPESLTLREVLEAVEGPLFVNDCLVHGAPCPIEGEHWCPMHDAWQAATGAFLRALEGHSVGLVARRVRSWELVESELAAALANASVDAPPSH